MLRGMRDAVESGESCLFKKKDHAIWLITQVSKDLSGLAIAFKAYEFHSYPAQTVSEH